MSHALPRLWPATLLCLLVIGCSTPPVPKPAVPLEVFSPHQISGRLITRYQEPASENVQGSLVAKQQSARFFLQRDSQDHSVFQVLGPFGIVLVQLEIGRDQATLSQMGKAPVSAATVPALVARYTVNPLPIPIPLPEFYDWLNGRGVQQNGQAFVVDHSEVKEFDAAGGWHLNYQQWDRTPPILVVTNALRPDIEVRVQREELFTQSTR